MSKKKWCAVVVLFLFAAASAVGVVALLPPTPGITYANYSRIETGMTREQVELLLGQPNLDDGEFRNLFFPFPGVPHGQASFWRGDERDIVAIAFDPDNDFVAAMSWN